MIKKLNEPNIVHRKVTTKGTKTETLEALNELGWVLQNLVNQQSLMVIDKAFGLGNLP